MTLVCSMEKKEEVEVKCVRCGYEWKGKDEDKPDKCPECELVPWDGDRKVPRWKYGGIVVTEKKRVEPDRD